MKKSLIALAAAGMFAPAAFAATANVDVYGILHVAIEDADVSGSDMQVTDRYSRIGFKGSEDLGNGLKAIWQIESGLGSGTDGMGTGSLGSRNTFVGLAGDFGVAVLGRHDTPYKLGTASLDPFADTAGDYNAGCVIGCINAVHDHRSPNAIAYISPTWSGFHFAVAGVATNTPANLDSGDTIDAVSATGVYVNGPLFASLSYQNVEESFNGLAANAQAAAIATAVGLTDANTDGSDAWKAGVGYTFGDAKVGLIYENVSVDSTGALGNIDIETWLVNATYAMGPVTLMAQYATQDLDGFDNDTWSIGAAYSLSKRTTAYVAYTNTNVDNGLTAAVSPIDDVSAWALGLKHSF